MRLGIDASNIRGDGGVTHLLELLRVAEPNKYGISKIIVWSGEKTLAQLEERPWLKKINQHELNGKLVARTIWQSCKLVKAARAESCDLLFVPGGSIATNFRPVVTMSRNMLPFEWKEMLRYGISWLILKNLLLRLSQSRSFKKADGVIFLTKYAQKRVQNVIGAMQGQTVIIPHGINSRFLCEFKKQLPVSEYSEQRPLKLVYVSKVNPYKHQWNVVKAVANLRKNNFPVTLDLIGSVDYAPSFRKLETIINQSSDAARAWVTYHGSIPYEELHDRYREADIGIFASSCENMPNILLENMMASLPIACSDMGPMPEVLGDAGVYFDPEKPESIANALRKIILSPELRSNMIAKSKAKVNQYSWERCADETFGFLTKVASVYKYERKQ